MKQNKLVEPEWYWSQGLHDANIISATEKVLDWGTGDKCLILELDCNGALFESDITQIRFYNTVIKTNSFDLSLLCGGWWLCDELLFDQKCYRLKLEFDTEECITKHLDFTFSRAEVMRK